MNISPESDSSPGTIPNALPTGAGGNPPVPAPPKVPKQVWVVDDDEVVLMLAEGILVEEGFQVKTFSEPARALAAVPLGRPDIIVLDVMMPDMDGFEFCSRLRAHPAGQDVPVLMVTTLEDSSSITRAYEAGATNFATKPLNWAVESHRLRYMLRVAETSQLLKSKELETRQAKEDWERTFNSFSDIVTLLSPDLKILRANQATATALKKPLAHIVGAHCYQLFNNAEVPCPHCPIVQAIQTGVSVSAEHRYQNPAADCLLTGTPVKDDHGALLHVVHIARDLTEQKQLEREYRHAQKMEAMGTFAGGIAHDFNNLLMVVSGCGEMIQSDPQTTGEQKELAETVLEASQRGTTLAKQLLTFSRKGASNSGKRLLQLDDMIRDLQKMLQRLLPKNISIHTHFAAGQALIKGSNDQLHQVVMNLAVNAAQAMPGGGSLTIETRKIQLAADYCRAHPEVQAGNYVLVTVSDTGHGMDQNTLQRMYEPFFTTKKIGEGTGLGLSVVYGIIKDHGGHIECRSQVGAGTTFSIFLPDRQRSDETDFIHATTRPVALGGAETILIVDDEAAIRAVVQRAFIRQGYSVISADSGESALLRYGEAADRIRLVVLDLGMPGMGGWECLKQLRVLNPKLPVLLTTGYGGQDFPERARQEGAQGLISKPYQLEVIFRTVREMLDGRHRANQAESR